MITRDGKMLFGMPFNFEEWLRFTRRELFAKHYARCFSYELFPKDNGKVFPTSPTFILDLDGKRRPVQFGSINNPST